MEMTTASSIPTFKGSVLNSRRIRKVAVLGSGVMGSQIAMHMAGVGLEVLLLDIAPKELNPDEAAKGLEINYPAVRNRIVKTAFDAALKLNPNPIYDKKFASRIHLGNFEDDMKKVGEVDWILEVVVER